MPEFFPADFPSWLEFLHRVSLNPIRCLTTPRPWAPLTDAEWETIAPFLAAHGCGLAFTPRPGRPPKDTRARLDAIFRAVTLKHPRGGRASWARLPEAHGKADTLSRTYRRWAHANLWARLLMEAACPTCPAILRRLTYWICCAFRRGIRIMGLRLPITHISGRERRNRSGADGLSGVHCMARGGDVGRVGTDWRQRPGREQRRGAKLDRHRGGGMSARRSAPQRAPAVVAGTA